jgi:hypothetical protein
VGDGSGALTSNRSYSVALMSTLVVRARRLPAATPGQVDHQRYVTQRLVQRHAGLAEDVPLAEIVTVVGADDDGGVVPQVARPPDRAPRRTSDRSWTAWRRSWRARARLALRQNAALHGPYGVGRPDHQLIGPVGVVSVGPGRRRVERLVGVELVDEQQEAVVGAGILSSQRPPGSWCAAPENPAPRGSGCG